ncbi:MAG: tetratricopeptide/SEL1-like repeat protein [Candidatus Sedimenticola sp. (ex Thyasira tokunagai)]
MKKFFLFPSVLIFILIIISACGHKTIQNVYWDAGTSVAIGEEKKGNIRSAETEFKVALTRAERELDKNRIASSNHNLGAFYRRQNRLSDAIHYLNEALKLEAEVSGPNSERTGRTLAELAAAYLMENNFFEGRPIANRLEALKSYYRGDEAVFVERVLEFYQFDTEKYNEAVARLKPLADSGDPKSQRELAYVYSDSPDAKELMPEILKLYRSSAEQSYSESQYYLGVIYDKGRGVESDNTEARKWYRIAAENGHPVAQFNYGVFLEQGRGGPKNESEAWIWFKKSAKQGYPSAQRAMRQYNSK